MDAGVHLTRPRREEDLGGEADRACQLAGVRRAELVGDARPAAARRAHAARRLVRDEGPEGAEPGVARHAGLVRGADAGQDRCLQCRVHELALDEDALAHEVVDVVGLGHLFPAAHLLVEERADAGRGMDVQVPASPARRIRDAAPLEQRGGEERAARHDDVPGKRAELASGLTLEPRIDADRAAAREEDPVDAAAGVEPGAGGLRARDVRDVHRLLGVLRAADRAHPGAEAAALVARDPCAVVAEGRGAALEQPAVPAVRLVGHRPDAELRLDALEIGAEVGLARARDAVSLGPLLEDVVRRPIAGARVDGRRPADAAPERDRDGRPAERHREPAITVEEVDHRTRIPGEVLPGEEPALLEQHDVLATRRELARDDRAAGARADDDHIGLLVDVFGDRRAVDGRRHLSSRAACAAAFGPARSFRRRYASS